MLLDANILLAAVNQADPRHARTAEWLERAFFEAPRLGLPWASLLAFVRIAINPRLLSPALEVDVAWGFVEEWLDQEAAWVPEAGPAHRKLLSNLVRAVRPSANQVPDLHLAALALEHGLTVYSFDGDFAAFPGVRWQNPLAQARRSR